MKITELFIKCFSAKQFSVCGQKNDFPQAEKLIDENQLRITGANISVKLCPGALHYFKH